jgi:hypothetical protein
MCCHANDTGSISYAFLSVLVSLDAALEATAEQDCQQKKVTASEVVVPPDTDVYSREQK